MASSVSSAASTITFNGSSTFSSSFQQVLQRAVSIASLPIQLMQADVTTFQQQQSDLASLQSAFASLQSDIQDISTSTEGSMAASVSDGAVVSATTSPGALAGTYSIEVDSTGSSTTTISNSTLPTVTDPTTSSISNATSFTLTVNSTTTTITPTGNSLEDLASAINSAGAGVQATIVNLGSNTSPNYRLSLTSTNLGSDSIQLSDTSGPLLTTLTPGTDALYKVNGNSTQIQSTSSEVTLAPGLTVNLLQAAPSEPVTITVAPNFDNLSNQLSTLATDYNSAVQAVAANVGQSGGALSGESIVYSLNQVLSQIAEYSGTTGTVKSLSDLGLNLSSTGQLSFDASTFSAANPADVQSFLGGVDTGGFLQSASNAVAGVADPTTGALTAQYNTIGGEITNENTQISNAQARVTTLQNNLTAQLSAADAAIAVLEQQKTYYANLFAAEYLNNNPSGTGG